MNRLTLTVTMTDGTVHRDLAINNHAMVSFDFAANKHRWPAATEAPFLWLTFLAWQQLVDDGLYPAADDQKRSSWRTFQEQDCLDIERTDDQQPVDPTTAGQPPVSASPPQPD